MESVSEEAAIERVVDALRRGMLCLFFGAGVTVQATGDRSTGWQGLLSSAAETCRTARDSAWLERVNGDLASPYPEDSLAAADKITAALGRGFRNWVHSIGMWRAAHFELLDELKELASDDHVVFVTTNYDTIVGRHIGRESIHWQQTEAITDVMRRDWQAVIHVHGVWSDPETVVFGGLSYGRLVGHRFTETWLQDVFSSRTLLFIGCGGTLSDPNLSRFARLAEVAADCLVVCDPSGPSPSLAGDIYTPVPIPHDQLPAFLRRLNARRSAVPVRGTEPRPLATDVLSELRAVRRRIATRGADSSTKEFLRMYGPLLTEALDLELDDLPLAERRAQLVLDAWTALQNSPSRGGSE